MRLGLGLVLISGVAVAAPRPITLKVQNTPLYDVARKLGEQSGCRIMAFSAAMNVDLDLKNATLWDALAKLEVDHGIYTQFRGSQIVLDNGPPTANRMWGLDPSPTWLRHWRGGASGWAVALIGDHADTRARLVVVGTDGGSVDKVVVDKASAGGKSLKATPTVPVAFDACSPAVVLLALDGSPKKLSLRGHVVVKLPKIIERRVVVPLDNSVVDFAEGRLRVHVSSKQNQIQNTLEIHVGWDGMGDPVRVSAQLVDDKDQPVSTTGRGSSSAGSMGSESYSLPLSAAKLTLILTMPSSVTVEEKIPFRFDNEPLDKPTAP